MSNEFLLLYKWSWWCPSVLLMEEIQFLSWFFSLCTGLLLRNIAKLLLETSIDVLPIFISYFLLIFSLFLCCNEITGRWYFFFALFNEVLESWYEASTQYSTLTNIRPSSFLDTYSLSMSYLRYKSLHLVINILPIYSLVFWSFCLRSSIDHLKYGLENITRYTAKDFIVLMRFLQQIFFWKVFSFVRNKFY